MTNIVRFSKKSEAGKSPGSPAGTGQSGLSNQTQGVTPGVSNVADSTAASNNLTFEQIAQRNKENAERLRKERDKANKNVLRSYRIK